MAPIRHQRPLIRTAPLRSVLAPYDVIGHMMLHGTAAATSPFFFLFGAASASMVHARATATASSLFFCWPLPSMAACRFNGPLPNLGTPRRPRPNLGTPRRPLCLAALFFCGPSLRAPILRAPSRPLFSAAWRNGKHLSIADAKDQNTLRLHVAACTGKWKMS
jgi:hypothetical protein